MAEDVDMTLQNNDCCYLCGQGGRMMCCDTCPRSYHTGCLAPSERNDLKKYEKWSCKHCLSGTLEFSLNDMIDSIFIPTTAGSANRTPLTFLDPLSAVNDDTLLHNGEDDSDSSGNHSENMSMVSIGSIILTLEWLMPNLNATDVPIIFKEYFESVSSIDISDLEQSLNVNNMKRNEGKSDHSEMYTNEQSSLQFNELLWRIRSAVGNDLFDEVYLNIADGKNAISVALAPSIAFMSKGCFVCNRLRYFRTFCHICGHLHDVNEELPAEDELLPNFEKIAKLVDLSGKGGTKSSTTTEKITNENDDIGDDDEDEDEESEISLHERYLACAKRGIEYFFKCMTQLSKSDYHGNSGDMLFLCRNLLACTGINEDLNIYGRFTDAVEKWIDYHALICEIDDTDFMLDTMEGLHVVNQLYRHGSYLRELYGRFPPTSKSAKLDLSLDGGNDKLIGQQNGVLEVLHNGNSRENPKRLMERVASKRLSSKRSKGEKSGDKKFNESIPPDLNVGEFKIADIRNLVEQTLQTFHIDDVMGYDPTISMKLPQTPRDHCSNCSTENSIRGRGNNGSSANSHFCSKCNHLLKMKVDYGSLTDALVWGYVYEDCGIDIRCNNRRTCFAEVSCNLPLARCYQRIDELGHNFYKLQCYYLTHLIYVFSDWGQHCLRRQLFAEEFEFVVRNMKFAIYLDDPEIVGEFIQCLKIMQVTKQSDPLIWPLVEMGYKYLVAKEEKGGKKGMWVADRETLYNRYHSSYCAVIGILDYYFMSHDGLRLCPNRSRAVNLMVHRGSDGSRGKGS